MIKQWLRFPFAMAGPVSAAVLSIVWLVGLATVIALPKDPLDPYLVAGGTLVLVGGLANVIGTRYARRRGIDFEACGSLARAIPR
jgi:hypothetical protein